MSHARHLTPRCLLPALAGALLLIAGPGSDHARAAEPVFGGLGRVGATVIKPGTGGTHGQVSASASHNFAVDAKNGDFFIAEDFEEEGHNAERIQEFGQKGEFLAENRVKLATRAGSGLGGITVDAERNRVYMLVTEVRPEESEAIQAKIETKEAQVEKKEEQIKKKEEKGESVTELKAEVATLRSEIKKLEEELPVFDPGLKAAGQIWSFSTEASAEKLKEQKLFTSSEVLKTRSEEAKAPLLDPAGITVDPNSHDLVLLGQQDESPRKGTGEEELRAAAQRVHEAGTLGPRYVDQENCLDEGAPSAEEPACAKKPHVEAPRSPIITPAGSVYVELTQAAGEIWEIPAQTEATEGFKDIPVHPKRVFTLTNAQEQQKLVSFGGEEEVANTMSYVPVSPTEGRIYVNANIEGNLAGVVVLNYVKHPEGSEVTERGWTAGQSQVSTQQKCVIPAANGTLLLGGGSGENVLVLDTRPELEGTPAFVDVMAFGSGGEACGHVTATPPTVEFGETKNATEVPVGQATTLASKLAGANARGVKWTFKYTSSGEKGEETGPFESGYQFESISFNHPFLHVGEYEISETIETDNLGTPTVVEAAAQKLIVKAAAPKLSIVRPASIHAGEPVTFEATVTDHNETKPHLKYTWSFGDGSAPVVEEESATEATVTHRAKPHTYSGRCGGTSCIVGLTVEDASGAKTTTKVEVGVGESNEEEAARKKKEQEEAAHKPPEETTTPASSGGSGAGSGTSASPTGGGGGGQVLHAVEVHNPEAKLASTSLSVATNGAFTVKVTCPAGETACVGTLTLRTANAVSAKTKKAILMLASGSFSVAGGQVKTVTLHLSAKARSLLAHTHSLHALSTLVAHDASGTSRTTKSAVLLRLLKPSHGHKH